mmetsp:Transcript_21587/g.39622  ORF Transcript_21587/g.39622 Transcript_21587/m.39622 type:complete len:91 (+) Transcript_21587:298-570(+)
MFIVDEHAVRVRFWQSTQQVRRLNFQQRTLSNSVAETPVVIANKKDADVSTKKAYNEEAGVFKKFVLPMPVNQEQTNAVRAKPSHKKNVQ